MDPSLKPTWLQLGPNLDPTWPHVATENRSKIDLGALGPTQSAPGTSDARFLLIFVGISNNFQRIFYQFGILFFMNVYLTALVDSYPEIRIQGMKIFIATYRF